MSDFTYYDKIESYVEGGMTPEEQQSFEEELTGNPPLKEEYDAYLATLKVIEHLAYEKLREKVVGLEKKTEARRFFISRRLMAVAASVLLLVGMGSFWFGSKNYSNQALFAAFYEAPNVDFTRGGNLSETIFDQAVTANQNKNLNEAIELLKTIPAEAPIYNSAQYLLGDIYLKTNQPEEANATFQSLLKLQDKRYAENVEWKLILSYLQTGNMQAINERLDQVLAHPDHFYHEKALELKRKLGSIWRKLRIK